MIKCFLSHSSKDKKLYIDIVANKLKAANCIYDEFTFETGERTLDEILKGLKDSSLFVIFLSEAALQSEWVKIEIINAKKMLDAKEIKKIYPLLIDQNINHYDERIPQWMKDEYNLKYISRPTLTAKRILQRLREISWEIHPDLKEQNKIFVGRNSLINKFEERIDDFDMKKPSCIIASGIPSIGRRSLVRHCLLKTNILKESYRPSFIYLNSQESIEDLIIKIHDLGFSKDAIFFNLMSTTVQDKTKLAIDLTDDIQKAKDIVFIIDNGCIVTFDRQINSWFIDIIEAIGDKEALTFCLISKFRPNLQLTRQLKHFYCMETPELTFKERKGLLKRYSELEKLDLSKDDLSYFSNLLTGYPEQVFFTVHQIKDDGLPHTKKKAHLIAEYNSIKVQLLLSKWEDDEKILNFLRLLSDFDFISYELVYEIVKDNELIKKAIKIFRGVGIIELIGANSENIRVIDNVRDYIKRQKLSLDKKYKKRLSDHIEKFLTTYKNEEKDLPDFLYSMQMALKNGETIEEKYLLPSHFFKTIKELYDQEKKYNEVVKLADRVLSNNQFLDPNFLRDVRYYLCLALARLKDIRCVKEAHSFKGAQLNFILGFYYRLTGQYSKATERLEAALKEQPKFGRAKREIVSVFQHIGEYELAHEYAKQNYEKDKLNPYHIQAYLACLLKDLDNKTNNSETIKELLNSLNMISSDVAKEMYLTGSAEYLAFHKQNEAEAINTIQEAKDIYPNRIYPKLMKFDIYVKFNNSEGMRKALNEIKSIADKTAYFNNFYIRRKCILTAKTKGFKVAKSYMSQNMRNYPEKAKERFTKLLYNCSKETNGKTF
ncbi:MAG: TIR domain-containing protein [Deltaproteobacteria bacterium]|nr:TIR domain-containing protein [Deltaproteobacteria bacterium]